MANKSELLVPKLTTPLSKHSVENNHSNYESINENAKHLLHKALLNEDNADINTKRKQCRNRY